MSQEDVHIVVRTEGVGIVEQLLVVVGHAASVIHVRHTVSISILSVVGVGEAVATQDNSGVLSSGATGTEMSSTFGSVDNTTTIDGYLPDNKKLLTYPYNFYNVDNKIKFLLILLVLFLFILSTRIYTEKGD